MLLWKSVLKKSSEVVQVRPMPKIQNIQGNKKGTTKMPRELVRVDNSAELYLGV